MATSSLKNAILKHVRIPVTSRALSQNPNSTFLLFRPHFSIFEDVRGSFLDKSEVNDRVVSVVKNFQKCDPSKKMDMGPCSKVHSLHLRKEYEEAKAKGVDNYDRDLEDVIDRLFVECERKITRSLKRLSEEDA